MCFSPPCVEARAHWAVGSPSRSFEMSDWIFINALSPDKSASDSPGRAFCPQALKGLKLMRLERESLRWFSPQATCSYLHSLSIHPLFLQQE